MIRLRLIKLALTVFPLFITGCYATYTGFYYYAQTDQIPKIEIAEIGNALNETLKPLGFSGEKPRWSSLDIFWLHNKLEFMLPEYAKLDGSRASIYISVNPDETITIRDFDNDKETEFMKVVKQKIEHMLRTQFGMKEPQFKRAMDFMGP